MSATKLPTPQTRSHSIVNPTADFWLLGGASITVWVAMSMAQLFRDKSEAVGNHFTQIAAAFSLFALFCNHPHFIISYRLGYGRGLPFIIRNWFALLLVPLGLVGIYAMAYLHFNSEIADLPGVSLFNRVLDKIGLGFRLGKLANLGSELLSLSVWLMYLTVGWHYSKQVFGCMMVYAQYDQYSLSQRQRKLIKASVFSIAIFNFIYFSTYVSDASANGIPSYHFLNIPLTPLGLSPSLLPWCGSIAVGLAILTTWFVFWRNLIGSGQKPSLNFLVPWIAFYVWWIPFPRQAEYYAWAVPFFHSLQYLPFAYRLERPKFRLGPWLGANIFLRVVTLLFVGFCAFELVPSVLDQALQTPWFMKTWFFMIAFVVFINVHHFFIDSVVWKFNSPEVRNALLHDSD